MDLTIFYFSIIPNENQSHHFAGLFFLSYYTGSTIGIMINHLRDPDNPGDINLGKQAALDASAYRRGGSISSIVDYIDALFGE